MLHFSNIGGRCCCTFQTSGTVVVALFKHPGAVGTVVVALFKHPGAVGTIVVALFKHPGAVGAKNGTVYVSIVMGFYGWVGIMTESRM